MITPLNIFRVAMYGFVWAVFSAGLYGLIQFNSWLHPANSTWDTYKMVVDTILSAALYLLTICASVFGLLMVLVLPALYPAIKLALMTRAFRWMNPMRVKWAKSKPNIEVPEHAWRGLFDFQQIQAGINWKFLQYHYPAFKGEVRPEVSEWCRSHLTKPPKFSPPYVQPENSGVRIFLIFDNPNDALAFKMRWI
ncbi:MAG: hypothetical protein EOP83_06895 [Verrucomicrobiaceae bacterium]|nr:MAG: hypothetical protein EOP83_06895 [Verrucomicrobiaceae bacterium]